MNHEPECGYAANATWEGCMCEQLRAAYQRGREDTAQVIRNLHREIPYKAMDGTPYPECACCNFPYPCPTIKALDAALGGEQG